METKRKDIKYQLNQGYKLQTIMHYVNKETLIKQHEKQQEGKASGVDGVTKEEYGKHLESNIENLLKRMKTFSYKPKPVKKTYIPKSNGKLRGLGIPCYEDKLVQGAMAEILNEIYENIFYDFSYGFRPKKNCHKAVSQINWLIMTKKVNYILDADIKGFFDNIDHEILMMFLEHEIADKNFLRYIKRFLKAGVLEDYKYYESDKGTPQGGVISPILANVYLHYVLDNWYKVIKKQLKGEVYLIRYADDFVVMFQYEETAKKFYEMLIERMRKFKLELAEDKTRILPFGRFKGTNEEFDFLGFTFGNGRTINGKYRPNIKTNKKKLKQKFEVAKKWLHDNMHESLLEVGLRLKRMIIGHYAYYGINGNYKSLVKYYKYLKYTWYHTLRKRGQKNKIKYYKYLKYTWYHTLRKRGQKNKIKYLDFLRIWNYLEIPMPKIYVNIW